MDRRKAMRTNSAVRFKPQDPLGYAYISVFALKNGEMYNSILAAYEAQRFPTMYHNLFSDIINASAAIEQAHRLLQMNVPMNRGYFEDNKSKIMASIIESKLNFRGEFRDALLATGDKYLLMDTTVNHDCYWGSCSCSACNDKGKNEYGLILMRLRTKLQRQI